MVQPAPHTRFLTVPALIKRGKLRNVVVTAIARELAGFIWAIHRALTEPQTAT